MSTAAHLYAARHAFGPTPAQDWPPKECSALMGMTVDLPLLNRFGITTDLFGQPMGESWADELDVATTFVRLLVELVSAHAWSCSLATHCMPYNLAVGLHEDAHVAARGLQARKQEWEAIMWAEGLAQEAPQLAKLLSALDFHRMQLVREACHLMSTKQWSHADPEIRLLLWWSFGCIGNTKTFLEDTFRDLRQQEPKSGVTGRWVRMQHVLQSGSRRCKEHNLPLVELLPEDWRASTGLSKRRVTTAMFAAPTHRAKAAQAMEMGLPVDVGLPVTFKADGGTEVVNPLIDLSLLTSKRGRKDSAALLWKAAGPEANFRSAAAAALLVTIAKPHAPVPADAPARACAARAAEAALANAWWGCLLGKGLLFELEEPEGGLEPLVFLSLGFHGYAALGWRMVRVGDGAQFYSMVPLKQQGGDAEARAAHALPVLC